MNISCIPNLQDVRSSGPLTEHTLDVRQAYRASPVYEVPDWDRPADPAPLTLTQRIRAALAWRPVLTWRDEFWGIAVLLLCLGWVGVFIKVCSVIGRAIWKAHS